MFNNKHKDDLHIFNYVLKETCCNTRILESDQFIQHGKTTIFQHSIFVAYLSYKIVLFFGLQVNKEELIRGALLHDYFLYDWHKKDTNHRLHGFRHPTLALKNALSDVELSVIEVDIIKKHMFPLTLIPPRYLESLIVCLADKICASLETFHINLYNK